MSGAVTIAPMHAILDLLLPPVCPGCGLEGRVLCARCAAMARPAPG